MTTISYSSTMIRDLLDGRLPWPDTHKIMSGYKDADRFQKYRALVQETIGGSDPVVLPIGERLVIVRSAAGLVVRCFCGFEFGDYRTNWKLAARIRVRDTEESLEELYPGLRKCDPQWMEIRELICPGCAALLEVEAVPPGYPLTFDFLPDLEGFYEDFLGEPLPERAPDGAVGP
ncbi:MAG TPA: acetone carboxylase subunit gamma [Acidimicrobiales bacterium]|nr:acetone carboxylase subunit gamma [Acidimicrobiales bacterium]